jgi:hypothetical protein
MTYETRYNKITHGGGGGVLFDKQTINKKKSMIMYVRLLLPP